VTDTSERLGLDDVAVRASRILDEVERAVIGKRPALELALCALLPDGHVLIEDTPASPRLWLPALLRP
jgi:MoxR-like ATPase